MKKLLALAVLALPSLGWGANSSLTVSSGTFLAVDGFTPANTNFRQAITIADPNATVGVASVDPITGLTVHLASSTVSIGNVNIISTQPFTVISTGVVTQAVTGTFFQATQPIQGTVNIISTQPFTVISTGVVTQPVSGTFFQAVQPISYGAGSIVSLSTTQVVNTTVGVAGIVPVVLTSTPPVQVFGSTIAVVTGGVFNLSQVGGSNASVNADTGINVHLVNGGSGGTASNYNAAFPGAGTAGGFVNASGLMQAGRVDVSSNVFVYLANPTTGQVSNFPQTYTVTPGTGTFPVSGSLSVVSLSTGQINTAVPQVANFTGFVNASGLMQSGRVDVSSNVFVYLANPTTGQVSNFPQTYTTTPGTGTTTVNFNGIAQSVLLSSGVVGFGQIAQQVTSTSTVLAGGNASVGTVLLSTVQVVNTTITVANVQSIVNVVLTSTPPVTVIQSTVGAVGMYADNGVSSATNRVTTLDGVYQNGTSAIVAGSQGKDAAITIGTDHMAWVTPQPAILPYSYTASTNSFSIATSTNDAMAICGNAQHIVEVYGIRASCTQTTAGIIQIGIVKRSSAYSGVWSTASVVAESSNYTGSRSTATFFTSANLVVGTLVGYLDSYKLGCMATGTATPNDIYISPADWRMKPIILNSASECVAINLNGATITGGTMSATFDFEESYPTGYNPQ
jgi:hypothetical protein